MKGINFEEWKALVKKNRQALNTKSNIYRTEPESLTWGAEKAVKTPEYGLIHTITYNVTGMEIPSDWPTEIKSGKTLSLSIPAAPYGASQTVAANVDYTYTNDVLKINNVLNDITITVNIGEVLYENAKVGDYLYSDWTFGPTFKTGYLGRCIGLAEYNDGKSVWCSPKSSTTMVWSTETIETGTGYDTMDNARTATNGKENTAILLSLGANKYPPASWAAQKFEGNGYLPAAGLLYNNFRNIVYSYNTFANTSFHVAGEYSANNSFHIQFSYYASISPTLGYGSKTSKSIYAVSFIDLSGKPGKPVNNNGHEYVDLGLPSGTLWATMNVGATSSTEYGDYYMYGMGAKTYDSTDTPYSGAEDPLDLTKDTARQTWGGDWHMPTRAQMEELTANTTYQWVTDYNGSGINGGTFTATNGNHVFFPAAGNWSNGSQIGVGSGGGCLGSSPDGIGGAYSLGFNDGYKGVYGDFREYGCSVRPVIG